jgi:flagellar biosynthesis protein FlhB
MKNIIYSLAAFTLPLLAYAQPTTNPQAKDLDTLKGILVYFIELIDTVLIPLVFSLALILFLFGVFKFFFTSGAAAEENRQQGKKYILWAIIAFVVMVSIWGIVNIVVRTFDFQNETRPNLPCFSGDKCNKGPAAPGPVSIP